MRRATLVILAFAVLMLIPVASAAWTTSASVPASFRPNRTVAFTYTATSSSALDLGANWMVRLVTCKDINADNACTSGTDSNYHDMGEKSLVVGANAAGSVSWSLNLNDPVGAYRYDFTPRCAASPCTSQPPVAGDTKHGAFTLAYTNTWTRTLTIPSFVANNTSATLTYRLASTSADDADLAGSAELFTTPSGSATRSEGSQTVSALANSAQTLSWIVSFAPTGRQQESVVDSTTPSQSVANASVLNAHLHLSTPRANYTAGATLGMYLVVEGHGNSPDPAPLQANVQLVMRNGTFTLLNTTLRTDANGTAYLTFQSAEDLAAVDWNANTTISWNGVSFAPTANGTIAFRPLNLTPPAVDLGAVDALRADVANQSLHGVHLDEIGTHNLLLEIGRVALYASIIAGLALLVIVVSFRV